MRRECIEPALECAGSIGKWGPERSLKPPDPDSANVNTILNPVLPPQPKLSVITHVYNEQATMDAHVSFWKSLPPDVLSQVEFLCVDDFSDQPLRIEKGPLNLRLFRVTDDIEWNMPGCKNLAVAMSRADWLLFFDIDNIVDGNGFRSIVGALGSMQRNTMYRFRRVQDGREVDSHINTMVLSKWGFYRAGWMDEDFAGHYGYDDVHFHNMWNKYVGNQVLITDIAFQQLNIRTESLNRDQTHNYNLIRRKVMDEGVRGSVGKIRFNWAEVELG